MNEAKKKKDENGKGFWTTLPGILTAVAALITALTGLLVGLQQAGIIGQKKDDTEKSKSTVQIQKNSNPSEERNSSGKGSQEISSGGPAGTAAISTTDGKTTIVNAGSLIFWTGHDFELQSGQTIPFDKLKLIEVADVHANRARIQLTLLDDSRIDDSVDASPGHDFQGENELGRITIPIQRVKRISFNR